ncbi:MAG: type II toxin-antitoxin system VapC family toxin [Planctomycetes bacterium]|nr:type II toxin-antitoxin system VapC family toxin [Planctomycetota bacterium]
MTSPVTLAECLAHPIRRGLTELVNGYRKLILGGSATEFHEIGAEAAQEAAFLRVKYAISLMDALQVAVAIVSGCEAFLTNDKRLSSITDIPVLLLEGMEP